jgi:hypothetical protein
LKKNYENVDLKPEEFASMLVGRWKSGAPLARRNFEPVSPKFSNNNEFLYLTNLGGAGTSNDPDGQIIPPSRMSD